MSLQNALEDRENISWLRKDGACPHQTADVFHFLKQHFDDSIIALDYCKETVRRVNWPHYSPDLPPYDSLYVGVYQNQKDDIYRQNPQTTAELKMYVSAACETIPALTLALVSANFVLRLHNALATNDGCIENIVIWF